MIPTFAKYHGAYCGWADAVLASKAMQHRCMMGADRADLRAIQFGHWVTLSAQWWAPVFQIAVAIIVGNGAKPQMVRINATRLVAGMAHKHSIRNWAISKFVRNAMRFQIKSAMQCCLDLAVASSRTLSAIPEPTTVVIALRKVTSKTLSKSPWTVGPHGAFYHGGF